MEVKLSTWSLYCMAHFTNGSRDSCSNMPRCDVQLTDKYGSPTLGDLQSVTAAVNSGMLDRLGEDAAGEIEVAVSSPVSSTTACMHDTVTICEPWKFCKSDQPAEHHPYHLPDWSEFYLDFDAITVTFCYDLCNFGYTYMNHHPHCRELRGPWNGTN